MSSILACRPGYGPLSQGPSANCTEPSSKEKARQAVWRVDVYELAGGHSMRVRVARSCANPPRRLWEATSATRCSRPRSGPAQLAAKAAVQSNNAVQTSERRASMGFSPAMALRIRAGRDMAGQHAAMASTSQIRPVVYSQE